MIHPQEPIYVAHAINTAHIEKLRDISCIIIAVGADRQSVMNKMVESIMQTREYMEFDPLTKLAIEADFVPTGGERNEWVLDSDELEMTYVLAEYLGDYLQVV